MKKVLLINPPLSFSGGRPYSIDSAVPPLGLLSLASYINKNSDIFRAEILDITVDGLTLKDIKEKISPQNYFVIGLTSMTPQLQGAVEIARFIKNEIKKEQIIFLGGSHISGDKNFIYFYPDLFDYAITGEAERTFLESLNKLLENQNVPKLQNSEAIADLDTIPLPDNSLIDRGKYQKSETILFSRGCPFKCYYCSRPAISKIVRYRSVKSLIEQIKGAYHYCDGYIDFQDDTFTINREIILEFCREVLKQGLNLHWSCGTRLDLVDEELLDNMKKSGCRQINFGIESGNERLRKDIIKKGAFSNSDVYRVFKLCRKNKIEIGAYFMIGHPTETREDLEDTKRMILNSKIDILGLSIPTPFPGAELYEIAEKEGVIHSEKIIQFAEKKLGQGYAGNYPVYVSQNLTKDYVYQQMQAINRRFYLNPIFILKRLKKDVLSFKKLKRDILDLVSLLLKGVSRRKPYIIKKTN